MHQDRTAASTPRELVDLIVDGNAERAPAMDTLMSAVNALGRDVAIRSGCGAGDCGACTVLVGGRPRLACLTRCFSATEAPVETTAWLYEHDSQAEVLIELLLESSAPQCGYCTSGLIASVVGWARAFGPPQNRAAAQAALAGVVCRCTGYEPYLQVILRWANHACWGAKR